MSSSRTLTLRPCSASSGRSRRARISTASGCYSTSSLRPPPASVIAAGVTVGEAGEEYMYPSALGLEPLPPSLQTMEQQTISITELYLNYDCGLYTALVIMCGLPFNGWPHHVPVTLNGKAVSCLKTP